ncbi:uncharacterized protein LOC122070158 [Macadamia integrifolia]|uniref:uncharacterized protein LOC122070158 n=1 Tax=Macadamia integrifolia TaxID=60698 RepID=UPI001C4FC4B5|nr:uncharacterized protein LOC122070158 [Macadamia integrifolia]
MAISQASVSKPISSPNKEKKKDKEENPNLNLNLNLNLNQSHAESDAGQSQQEAPPLPSQSPCSSPSKRRKCPGIRVIGGRIYDSENGKSCHQCRQKTMDFSSACKNLKNGKLCTIKFCHKCLLNRYGEKAEETAVSDDWKCPKCRGICNCSFCMKKRGHMPTGILVHTAKKTGFSNVSEMLHVTGPEILGLERTFKHEGASPNKKTYKDVGACPNEQTVSSKESVATPTRKLRKENSFDAKDDSNLQPMAATLDGEGNKVEEKKRKRLSQKDNTGEGSTSVVSPNQKTASNKEPVAVPTRKCGKNNFSNGKNDSNLCPMPSTLDGEVNIARGSMRKKLRQKDNAGEGSASGNALLKKKSSKVSRISEENSMKPIKNEENRSGSNDEPPNEVTSELQIPEKTSRAQRKKAGKKDERDSLLPAYNEIGVPYRNMDNATTKPKRVIKTQNVAKNATTTHNSDVDIQLPQGADLTTVAGIDLDAEDVGHALQFLEFCAAFGKVLNLKKGQPESILRELLCGRRERCSERIIDRTQYSSNVWFHTLLLDLIQKDLGKESHLLSATSSRDSWLKALGECISDSRCALKDFPANCFARGRDSYDNLVSSQKLRVLNFLCDETLGTIKLRNWIDEQNSKFVEREKEAKEKVLSAKDKEKCLKRKLQDEVAKAILLINGTPLSISEHTDLVSKIKVEAAKAHAETREAMGMVPKKKQRSDAIRTEPVLLDGDGCVYWKLRGYSREPNLLLQDIGNWDSVGPQEKWYSYDVEQTEMVEKYISSLRTKRLRTVAVPDTLQAGSREGSLKHESPDDSSSPSSPTMMVADSEDDQES